MLWQLKPLLMRKHEKDAFDQSNFPCDLLVTRLGCRAGGVILAVAAMLNFGSGVDAIATRLTVPCPGAAFIT